jgi:hypothetical protein
MAHGARGFSPRPRITSAKAATSRRPDRRSWSRNGSRTSLRLVDRLPLRLRRHPWRFCLLVAGAIAAAALVGGGFDEGPRNAVAEFIAVCAGFATLSRFLGLRR